MISKYRGKIKSDRELRAAARNGVHVQYPDERAHVGVTPGTNTYQLRDTDGTITQITNRELTLAVIDAVAIGRPWVPS